MMMNEKYVEAIMLKKELPEGSYLNDIPAVQWLSENYELKLNSPVTFFVGENGTGKSTLIEAIAVAVDYNSEGGNKDFLFSFNQTHSELCDYITVVRNIYRPDSGFFLRAESVYNLASYLEADMGLSLKYIGGENLHRQSHGESFMTIIENFGGNSLFILDEPEAALSPTKILELLRQIKRLVEMNSQFIIATHSPILMAFPGAEIFKLSAGGIVRTEYKQTAHYQITKQFLDAPEQMLEMIFTDI